MVMAGIEGNTMRKYKKVDRKREKNFYLEPPVAGDSKIKDVKHEVQEDTDKQGDTKMRFIK